MIGEPLGMWIVLDINFGLVGDYPWILENKKPTESQAWLLKFREASLASNPG